MSSYDSFMALFRQNSYNVIRPSKSVAPNKTKVKRGLQSCEFK